MLNVIHIAGRDDTTATARVVGSTIRCTNAKDGFLGDPGEFRRGHCALREAASDRQGGSEADPSVQTYACRRKEGLMQATHRVREAAALLHGVNQGKLECVEKFSRSPRGREGAEVGDGRNPRKPGCPYREPPQQQKRHGHMLG